MNTHLLEIFEKVSTFYFPVITFKFYYKNDEYYQYFYLKESTTNEKYYLSSGINYLKHDNESCDDQQEKFKKIGSIIGSLQLPIKNVVTGLKTPQNNILSILESLKHKE